MLLYDEMKGFLQMVAQHWPMASRFWKKIQEPFAGQEVTSAFIFTVMKSHHWNGRWHTYNA